MVDYFKHNEEQFAVFYNLISKTLNKTKKNLKKIFKKASQIVFKRLH